MPSRPRYIVRSVKVAAGSVLTAAAVGVLGVLGTVPAQAAVPEFIAAHAPVSAAVAGTLLRRGTEAPDRQDPQDTAAGERRERIAGIRAEMRQAVSLGLVTQEQADRFTARLADRIMRGL